MINVIQILFYDMDLIENYIGGIPGFYTLCMFATVYLLLTNVPRR